MFFEVTGKVTDNSKGGVAVVLNTKLDGGKIFFTTDSTAPTPQATPYTAPVQIYPQRHTLRSQGIPGG